MRKGLSLIELLVVIGIIAILAAILMGTFSGGTESARAARCLSNMRNLAAACQSYGVAQGHYPVAGSYEWMNLLYESADRLRPEYGEEDGWISWFSNGAYKKDSKGHLPQQSQAQASWKKSMYDTDDEVRQYCLTNGALWKYVSGNRGIYVCPLHAKTMSATPPNWSYAMNAYFKWDSTHCNAPAEENSSSRTIWYGHLDRADRVLLFAEVQFASIIDGIEVPTGTGDDKTDSILQYKGCAGCSSPEKIGFNHKTGKRSIYANVCFADGHTEKLVWPNAGLEDAQLIELTKWLCKGIDVSFDGKEYKNLTKDDDSE